MRAGGAGEIAGTVMKGFVGEQSKGEGFLGVFRDAEAGRWNDFDSAESGGKLRENERVPRAASRDD